MRGFQPFAFTEVFGYATLFTMIQIAATYAVFTAVLVVYGAQV